MSTTVKLVIAIALLPFCSSPLVAQECQSGVGCPYAGSWESGTYHLGTQHAFELLPYLTETPAMRRFMVEAGSTYEWSTRTEDGGAADGDTELTLFNSLGTQQLCYANDPDGPGARLVYTAPSTTQVFLRVTQAPCSDLVEPVLIVWRCASCPDVAEVWVPSAGTSEVACGEQIRLCDAGGPSNYPNNASGQVVLRATGDSRIELRGWFAVEENNDRLVFYDGVGTTGAVLEQLDNVGHLDHTGGPGQTITVSFHSDQSITMSGFDLSVTYSGSCEGVGIADQVEARWQVFPHPAVGTINLRGLVPAGPLTVTVTDLLGQVERSMIHTGGAGSIQLHAAPGFHLVELRMDRKREVHRVLVL